MRENGYISQESIQDLKSIAQVDGTFSKEDFIQLEQKTEQLYKEALHISGLTKNEKNQLKNMHTNLKQMKITSSNDIQVADIQKVFLALTILFPDTLHLEDKQFFERAQNELLAIVNEYEQVDLTTFRSGITDLKEEVRVSQSLDQENPSYAGGTEKEEQADRNKTGFWKGMESLSNRERFLMRRALESYAGKELYKEHKKVLKKVTTYLGETNTAGLMPIFSQWMQTGKILDADTIVAELDEAGYVPKNGKLDSKEKRNIRKAYDIFQEHGGERLFSEEVISSDEQPTQLLAYLIQTLQANVSLAETMQAQELMKDVEALDVSAMTLLRNMIGDLNYDGALINAPDPDSDAYRDNYKERTKRFEAVDKGIQMGTSLHAMMVDAEHVLGMEIGDDAKGQVIRNIAGSLAGYAYDSELFALADSENPTAEEMLAIFQQKPYLLAAVHQMLAELGSDARLVFQYGVGNEEHGIPSYADIKEAIAAQQVIDLGSEQLDDVLSETQLEQIDTKLSTCFENLLIELQQQMKEDKTGTLNTPEMRAFVTSLEQQTPEYVDKRKINTLGLIASTVTGNEGLGAGTQMNMWLSEDVDAFIQRLTVAGGLFLDKSGQPAVGLSFTAGGTKTNGRHSFYYAGGVGAGRSKNGPVIGPVISLGGELQVNEKAIYRSLDPKSAKHIGLVTNATLGAAGGTLYYSQDKLKGYRQAMPAIEASMRGIFGGLEAIDSTTTQAILEQLKETYPDTKSTTLEATARTMTRLLAPYAERWKDMDDRVKGKILEGISQTYALTWFNYQVENKATGIYVSNVGVGLQFVGSFILPTAGLGLSWFGHATYTETEASLAEVEEFQKKGIGAREFAPDLSSDVVDDMNNLFGRGEHELGLDDTFSPDFSTLRIPSERLHKDAEFPVNLHVHPAMKRFIAHKDGDLHIHAKTPMTIMATYREGKKEYDLIIGQTGLAETEQVLFSDIEEDGLSSVTDFVGEPKEFETFITGQELQLQKDAIEAYLRTEDGLFGELRASMNVSIAGDKIALTPKLGTPILLSSKDLQGSLLIHQDLAGNMTFTPSPNIGSGSADKLEITYIQAGKEVISKKEKISLDNMLPRITPAIARYVQDAGMHEELLRLRNGGERTQWLAYRNAIEGGLMDDALSILSTWSAAGKISVDLTEINHDDLRAIDAAMSVVQLTKDKLVADKLANTPAGREKKAKNLRAKIASTLKPEYTTSSVRNPKRQETLSNPLNEELILKLVAGDTSVSFDTYHVHFWHMLKGDAMENGQNTFKKVTSDMYQLYWMLAPNKHILAPRTIKLREKFEKHEDLSKESIDAFMRVRDEAVKGIGHKNTYDVAPAAGSYGMVLGYADNGAVEEKFLPNPEMAVLVDADTQITDDGLKQYFLKNLPDDSPILLKVGKYLGTENKEEIRNAIVAGGVEGKPLTASFKLGFYGKCFNETILLDELIIEETIEEEVGKDIVMEGAIPTKETYCSDGVFFTSIGTESIAHKDEKRIQFGWVGGDPMTEREVIDTESNTVIRDLEEYLNELQEMDPDLFAQVQQQIAEALSGEVQPGFTVTINGVDHIVDGRTVPGTDRIIYADTFTNPNQTTMMIYDTVTNEVIRAETIYGPYDQILSAIANKSLEMQNYISHTNNTTNNQNTTIE